MKFAADEIGYFVLMSDCEAVVCLVKAFSCFASPLMRWCTADCEELVKR